MLYCNKARIQYKQSYWYERSELDGNIEMNFKNMV